MIERSHGWHSGWIGPWFVWYFVNPQGWIVSVRTEDWALHWWAGRLEPG